VGIANTVNNSCYLHVINMLITGGLFGGVLGMLKIVKNSNYNKPGAWLKMA
jgi:hypothetical protein